MRLCKLALQSNWGASTNIRNMRTKKKRQKYGLRKGCLKEAFSNISEGDIRSYPLNEVNVRSFRTRAGELNMMAGHTKYSINVDRFYNVVRISNNG